MANQTQHEAVKNAIDDLKKVLNVNFFSSDAADKVHSILWELYGKGQSKGMDVAIEKQLNKKKNEQY